LIGEKGEEVKIPIVAFDYIYRNLNKLGIFDKDGNLNLINKEQYIEFQNKAKSLLGSDEKNINFEEDFEENEDLISIKKYDDGTVIEKNKELKTITIINPDGKIYYHDDATGKLIINSKKEDENKKNNEKEIAVKNEQYENNKKIKDLKTELTIIKNTITKKDKITSKTSDEKNIEIEILPTEKPDKIIQNSDDTFSKFTQRKKKKDKPKQHQINLKNSDTKIEIEDKKNEVILDNSFQKDLQKDLQISQKNGPQKNDFDVKKFALSREKNNTKEKNIVSENETKTKMKEEVFKQLKDFEEMSFFKKELSLVKLSSVNFDKNSYDDFLDCLIKYNTCFDIILFLISIATQKYSQYYFLDKEKNILYIDINLITYKFLCLAKEEYHNDCIKFAIVDLENKIPIAKCAPF